MLVNLAADIPYSYKEFWGSGVPPLWWTDIGYLASYLFAFAGLVVLARKVSPGRDLEAWIDSALLALAVIALVVAFIIGPMVSDAGGFNKDTAMGILYPVLDVVLFTALLRLLIVRRAPNLALTILAALWLEWSDPRVWKTVATFGILFFLAAIVYAIVNGLDRKSN